MTNIANINNVAYKKGNWMRYTLWGLAAICIIALIVAFINIMNEASAGYSVENVEKTVLPDKSSPEGGI